MRKLLTLLLFPFAVLAQNNTIAVRPYGQVTVTFTATPVFNASLTNSWKMTLTANVTSSTMTGAEAGQVLTFEFCQDGAGAHTLAVPTQFQNFTAIASGSNACTTEVAEFDGTNANFVSGSGGGGSGTVNSGTSGHCAIYPSTGTTVGSDANCDDGATSANTLTYAGSGGVASAQFVATGSGAWTANGTEGACPAPVPGHDLFCLGDSLSHTAKISDNGGPFLTALQYSNDSPTAYGPLIADTTFPRVTTVPIGVSGQPFLSQGPSTPPGYAALDVSSSNNVINRLAKANMATTVVHTDQVNTAGAAFTLDLSSSTAASPFRLANVAGFNTTVNGVMGYNATTNNPIVGMNSGNAVLPTTTVTPVNTNCVKWVVTSGNIQLGDAGAACGGGGGSPALNAIINATNTNTLDNANFSQIWRWQTTTAGAKAFRFSEPAASTSTGTPWLIAIDTFASSTLNPLIVTAGGTANGIGVLKSGFLSSVGTGGVDSNLLHCDVTDGTKCIKNVLSGITTATTRNKTWTDTVGTVAEDANTVTFTNKTTDAEGTGNVLTRPFLWEWTPACNNATADQGAFNVPTSGSTTFSCTGTTTTQGNADFVDASTTTLLTPPTTLPQGWVGNVDARIVWWANAASANAVRWSVASGCVADGAAISTGPSYNAASAANTAYTGTANQRKTTLLSAIAVTNCAAGSSVYFQIQRIGADAGDTLTATAELIEFQITGRWTK